MRIKSIKSMQAYWEEITNISNSVLKLDNLFNEIDYSGEIYFKKGETKAGFMALFNMRNYLLKLVDEFGKNFDELSVLERISTKRFNEKLRELRVLYDFIENKAGGEYSRYMSSFGEARKWMIKKAYPDYYMSDYSLIIKEREKLIREGKT